MKALSILSLVAVAASAQTVSLGVQGGVPALMPLEGGGSKVPFAIGPTVLVGFTPRLSLESGLLFHRLGDSNQTYALPESHGPLALGFDNWRGRVLEIPALVRFSLLGGDRTWQPFISGGASIRRTSVDFTGFSPNATQPTKIKSVEWNVDPTVGAGVSFRSGRVRVEPQVRYSYWGSGIHSVVKQNQVQFLFGLRF
jgi:hypothetical protein